MNDELIEWLLDWGRIGEEPKLIEAAARIKKLERANSDLANEFTAAASFLRQGTTRIEKLEAALREIAETSDFRSMHPMSSEADYFRIAHKALEDSK